MKKSQANENSLKNQKKLENESLDQLSGGLLSSWLTDPKDENLPHGESDAKPVNGMAKPLTDL